MIDGESDSLPGPLSPDPQLEAWIEKAAASLVHLPAMWRAMKTAELHVIVPGDPGVSGEFELGEGDALTVITMEDDEGPYAPVFTDLAAAEETAAGIDVEYAIASIEGATLFVMLAGAGHRVVVNPFTSPRLKINPELVQDLATGHFSRHRLGFDLDHTKLAVVASRDVPHDLLLAVRNFCARRRVATALYLFHPIQPQNRMPNPNDLRFVLRMHQRDDRFLKEFKDAFATNLPPGMSVSAIAVLDNQDDAIEFLESYRPIWPV